MRLFVAIDLPEEIKETCQSFSQEKLDGAQWVRAEQIHLTLRFIGDASEEHALSLRRGLGKIHVPSFSLSPQGLGCFPNSRRPRVLWLGLDASPSLLALQSSVENAVQSAGFLPELKAFSPHVTLARFRFSKPKQVEGFLEKFRTWRTSVFTVKRFILYSSLLLPQGAKHECLEEFALD